MIFSGKLFTIVSTVLTIVSATNFEPGEPKEHVSDPRCPLDVDGSEVWILTILFLSNGWEISHLATEPTMVPRASRVTRSTMKRARF